jgi:hypothetical protein
VIDYCLNAKGKNLRVVTLIGYWGSYFKSTRAVLNMANQLRTPAIRGWDCPTVSPQMILIGGTRRTTAGLCRAAFVPAVERRICYG